MRNTEIRFRLHNVFAKHEEEIYDRDYQMMECEQSWIDAAIAECKKEARKNAVEKRRENRNYR